MKNYTVVPAQSKITPSIFLFSMIYLFLSSKKSFIRLQSFSISSL